MLLLLLLAADLAFVLLHVNYKLSTNPFAYFDIEQDGGYAELYGYIKYLWAIILCACIRSRTGSNGYIAWALVFTYFLFDDALQLHENFGELVATSIDFRPPFNLATDDVGELAVSAIVGTFLLAALAWAWLRGSSTFRNVSKDLAILVLLLVFFGIAADMVHAASAVGGIVSAGLGLVEDAGELVVGSVILWYLFSLAMRGGKPDLFLHEVLVGNLPLQRSA
ncbi:MAG TPA: hypothetical protein VNQ14_16305 [Woeseiaceae bacterium]|nr:hypothetical protein [Woeseiaceae bacterium]